MILLFCLNFCPDPWNKPKITGLVISFIHISKFLGMKKYSFFYLLWLLSWQPCLIWIKSFVNRFGVGKLNFSVHFLTSLFKKRSLNFYQTSDGNQECIVRKFKVHIWLSKKDWDSEGSKKNKHEKVKVTTWNFPSRAALYVDFLF